MRQRAQTGYIYPRSGSWWVRWRETIIENGQPKRRHLAKKITPILPQHRRLKRPPPEVEQQAEQMLHPLNSGEVSIEATQNLVDFVEQVYFPAIAQQHRASTVTGYRNRWRAQLKARCAKLRLRDFQTPHGSKVLAGVAHDHPGLTKSTLEHLRNLLSGVFTFAMRQGYMPAAVNPMRYAIIPPAPEGAETHAYSLEEIGRILSALPPAAFTIAATAAFTGMRRSELRGLRWEDYSASELNVCRSVWELHVAPPKTPKSKAPVPVIGILAKILDAWREHCGNPAEGYIFASSKGTPLNVNNLEKRVIRPTLRQAGIAWCGWHAFRRGLATNLYALGVKDKVVQAILRHSNVAITQAHYIKTAPADAVAAMQLFEAQARLLCANCAQTSEAQPAALLQ